MYAEESKAEKKQTGLGVLLNGRALALGPMKMWTDAGTGIIKDRKKKGRSEKRRGGNSQSFLSSRILHKLIKLTHTELERQFSS